MTGVIIISTTNNNDGMYIRSFRTPRKNNLLLFGSKVHTAPLPPPRSILLNRGKTEVLPVLPPTAPLT
jgi:hypothetical protein